jgi:hypothetical protein
MFSQMFSAVQRRRQTDDTVTKLRDEKFKKLSQVILTVIALVHRGWFISLVNVLW